MQRELLLMYWRVLMTITRMIFRGRARNLTEIANLKLRAADGAMWARTRMEQKILSAEALVWADIEKSYRGRL